MGRAPCCDKENVKKGPWSPEEDEKLKEYIEKHGTGGNWIALPHKAGLRRCGKSCRLRWLNYLRPNIKHGEFSDEEDRIIYTLFASIGSRWSIIAAQLPGRTDNDIKNYWNTKLKKKLIMGMIPSCHNKKTPHQSTTYPSTSLLQSSSPLTYSSAATTPTLVQPQENYLNVGSIQCHYQVKESSVLHMFRGDHASCSSSDGSCNNQISHGRKMELINYGVPNGQDMGLESYLHSGVDENHKFMISTAEEPNGLCDETSVVDYSSLEEIKRLISTNNCCSNSMFFVDESKTDEKVMYY